MKYSEKIGDLFEAESEYALAHCIASDAIMGAGIAPKFVKKYPDMKKHLQATCPFVSSAVLWEVEDNSPVYNLITKQWTSEKPTYGTLAGSLCDMRNKMVKFGHKKLAIPLIGCGLDGLEWNAVKGLVKFVFEKTDIEIVVYFYDNWAIPLMEKEGEND